MTPANVPALLRLNAGRRGLGEVPDVQLVDDRVRFVWRDTRPIRASFSVVLVARGSIRKHAERRPPGVRAPCGGRLAIERGRKVHGVGIRIEQDFARIERMPREYASGRGTIDRIGVVTGIAQVGPRHAAMPDPTGLVPEIVELEREDRSRDIRLAKRDASTS